MRYCRPTHAPCLSIVPIIIDGVSAQLSRVRGEAKYSVSSGIGPGDVEQLLHKVYVYGIELLVKYFDARTCKRLC